MTPAVFQVPLLCYSDAAGAHVVELSRETTSVGRAATQDIVLLEGFVSRQHASIVRRDGVYELIDGGSTHGTYRNGIRIDRAVLQPGDELQFGSLDAPRLRFQDILENSSSSPVRLEQTLTPSSVDLLSSLSVITLPADERGSGVHGAVQGAVHGMEQLNFLLSAARQLNAGGGLADILRALLQLTLQLTSVERGFVFLCEGQGASDLRLALGLDLHGKVIDEDATVSRSAIKRAIASDGKFTVSDTLSDQAASEWQSVVLNKIRSIYCIPLRKRGAVQGPSELLGLLYLDSQLAPGRMSKVDHELLDTIANEAATLLHNALMAGAESAARKAREELAIAASIHQGLMSFQLPVLPYAKLAAKTVPCLGIGGDFFYAVALPDCVSVTIADVSGKGVSAAIVAATLQGIIHAQLLGGQGLPEIAALLNRFLCSRQVGKYVTCVMLKLFPDGRAEYINCGHVQPLLISGGEARLLAEGNTVVGLIPDVSYASTHIVLAPGDRILLMTDGVTEAENVAGEMLSETALAALAMGSTLDQFLDGVLQYYSPGEALDDVSAVDISYLQA